MSKISQLTTLALGDVSVYTDMIPILDASAGTVKKIPVATLQGYTSNAGSTMDFVSLVTSDYTVSKVAVLPLGGRLVHFRATIHNGSNGIPKTVANGASENIITFPSAYFNNLIPSELKIETVSEVPPTSSWVMQSLLPLYVYSENGLSIKRSVNTLDNVTGFIPNAALFTGGNIKGIIISGFALLKYDVPELPYN